MNTISKLVRGALVMTAAAAACAAVSRPANAQVLFSDNFNYGTSGLNFNAFPNWTVSDGTVDLIGAGTPYDFYPGNGQYVDLDGTSNNAGTLTSTSFLIGPGVYQLSFSLGKNGGAFESMQVSVGSLFTETVSGGGSIPNFQTFVRQFTVASGTTVPIVFAHAGGDGEGFIIDNVVLSTVPEPSTVALMMGPAALLLGGVMVRRRRNA